MNSKKQVDLPIWTIQACCLALSLTLLLLTGAIFCDREVPTTIYLGVALLCTVTNGWMLRVPSVATDTIFRIVEKFGK
jgi:hypothetical protein